jgi:hypothetical protein
MRVRLFPWNSTESPRRAAQLAALGYTVDNSPLDAPALRELRANPPEIALIDLSRSPSQGRDLGVNLRVTRATRGIQIVFAGGAAEKVAEVRALLPDAIFTSWEGVPAALEQAASEPLAAPIVPDSLFAGYSAAPLVKKLGIKPGMAIAALGEPEGFRAQLAGLPDGVCWTETATADTDLVLWFARSQDEVNGRIAALHPLAGKAGLWILWPKKGSPLACELSEKSVRAAGLAAGWVDYKIAAVDQTWSGLKFAWRK